jgi:class 3 adenylate cyclase
MSYHDSNASVESLDITGNVDVEWAMVRDESASPVTGFTSAVVESHYLVHLHKTIGAVVVVNAMYALVLPAIVVAGLSPLPTLDTEWYRWALFYIGAPVALLCIAAVVANAYLNKSALSRARVHDAISSGLIVFVVIFMGATELEAENECASDHLRKNPGATDDEVIQACGTTFHITGFLIFMECVACTVRTHFVYAALLASFVMLNVSLLYLTRPTISSDLQVAVRALIIGMVCAAVAVIAFAIDRKNRASFLLYKKVVQLTEASKETAKQINALLGAMLPESVLQRLAAGEDRVFDTTKVASVSFSDVVDFTMWSASRSSEEVVQMVSTLVSAYDVAAKECQVAKVKTIGDAYWAISGLPEPTDECAVRICNFALRQQELLVELNANNPQWKGIELRVGCHTGPLLGGVIGTQQLAYEVFGETNHVAQLFEQSAPIGGVLVSQATADHARHRGVFGFEEFPGEVDGTTPFVVSRLSTPLPVAARRRSSVRIATNADAALNSRDDRKNVMRGLGLAKRGTGSETGSCYSRRSGAASSRANGKYAAGPAAGEDAVVVQPADGGATAALSDDDVEMEVEADIETYRVGCAHRFANPETEEEYYEYDHVEKSLIRRLANGFIGAFGFVFLLGVLIEQPPALYGDVAASLVLFAACGGAFFGMAAVCHLHPGLTRAHAKAVYAAGYLLLCGYILAMLLLPIHMITKQSWHVVSLCIPMMYVSPPADVNFLLHTLACATVIVCGLLASKNMTAPGFATVFIVTALSSLWFAVIQNGRDRAAFKTKKLAEQAAAEARSEMALQRQILASMAPAHVQDDMVALVAAPAFQAGEPVSISHTLPDVTVCFCNIKTKADVDDAEAAYEDILGMHQLVETCLEKYPLVTKVKSVGNTVIVAGPLHVGATSAEARAAARQAFDFAHDVVHRFRALDGSRGIATAAGVSSGPAVASVMGTDRLAYDLFGDTVNTSSRFMSTAMAGTVQLPASARELYRGRDEAMPNGSLTTITMKGKGDVEVYRC